LSRRSWCWWRSWWPRRNSKRRPRHRPSPRPPSNGTCGSGVLSSRQASAYFLCLLEPLHHGPRNKTTYDMLFVSTLSMCRQKNAKRQREKVEVTNNQPIAVFPDCKQLSVFVGQSGEEAGRRRRRRNGERSQRSEMSKQDHNLSPEELEQRLKEKKWETVQIKVSVTWIFIISLPLPIPIRSPPTPNASLLSSGLKVV
jgi:hypothetical protein